VIAEEQRQMEMDFAVLVPSDDLAKEVGDEQVRTAVDGLGALESAMKDGP
jgi:type IV secretion system protein VirD4